MFDNFKSDLKIFKAHLIILKALKPIQPFSRIFHALYLFSKFKAFQGFQGPAKTLCQKANSLVYGQIITVSKKIGIPGTVS